MRLGPYIFLLHLTPKEGALVVLVGGEVLHGYDSTQTTTHSPTQSDRTGQRPQQLTVTSAPPAQEAATTLGRAPRSEV